MVFSWEFCKVLEKLYFLDDLQTEKQSKKLLQNRKVLLFMRCSYFFEKEVWELHWYFFPGSKFNAIKEEAICSKYVSGKCKQKTCHLYHPHVISQYVWQRRKKGTESWEDIGQTTSERLEKLFCDPNSDHFIYK